MLVIKDIPSLKAHLKKGRFYHNDVIPFLSVIRNEISDRSLQEKLKWLTLFCNWTLHTEISASMTAVDIIESFVNCLVDYDLGDEKSIKKFNNRIIDNFRENLIELFKIVGIDYLFLENDDSFFNIYSYILSIIHERPLKLPDINKQNKHNKILRLEKINATITSIMGRDCQIFGLVIKSNDRNFLSWILDTGTYIYIELELGYCNKRFSLNIED